jgi:peptidoglycan-N-acetylmuramic acid deacetylase
MNTKDNAITERIAPSSRNPPPLNLSPITMPSNNEEVQAVFFVTGHYVQTQSILLNRMVNEGHIIGNHSWHHPDMTQISVNQIKDELDSVKQEVGKYTAQKDMRFMRPPKGIFNDKFLGVSRELGYTNVFWSIAYVDWDVKRQLGSDHAYQNVMDQLHPGAVILLHSISKDNMEALAKIIDDARQQGFVFKRLDQLEIKRYR